MLLLSVLWCVPICSCELWIKLKSACATHFLPKPKHLQKRDAGKALLRYVGSLERHRRAEPQHLSEFSFSSRFQPHFFPFPIQRGEWVPLSWAGKSLEDWGTLSCALVRGCCWQLDLWLTIEKTVLSPGKKAPWVGEFRKHQWCSSWDCVRHWTSPSELNVLPTPYLSPILWIIFSLFYSSYIFSEMLTLYNEKL